MCFIKPSSALFLASCAVAALFASCGGSSTASSPPTTTTTTIPATQGPGGVALSIVRGAERLTTTAYSPNPVTVTVGTTVTWTNNDVTDHDATADNKSFATGVIAPGRSAAVTLQTPGQLTYYCTLHPGMSGTIVVQ